ncbi:uncharacterized protein LOC110463375 [Mizuhopecten yessoensis]|uniref:separase n=1 Tax=Mizuhopecten yessoensis TaxID=6573 RepID=A0A210PWC9_MIZYE|nr:uncharacterized protein LOC110463375 [Mizuhopecten yessoensis]OWF40766.1 Separin [Mizuhopecten yessoensis]
MAGQLFLSDLQSGNHETIGQDIENYLSPLLCKKNPAEREDKSKYGLYTVKFLHTSVSHVSSSRESTSLLQAVCSCYLGYKVAREEVKLNEPLTVLKLLYHLLTKLPQKGIPESQLTIAEHLHDELSYNIEATPGNVDTIIHNTYSYLWNVAAKLEQDQSNGSPDTVLKLRHAALKTLLLGPSTVAVFVEKYLVAFSRYDRVTVQYRDKGMYTDAEMYVDLTQDLLSSLIKRASDGFSTEAEAWSLLSVFLGLFKYILQRSLQNKISDCQNILEETKLNVTCQVSDAFSVVKNLFLVVDLLFKGTTGKCGKKIASQLSNVSEIFCSSFDNSYTSWPQTCKTFIHDMVTLLLKHMENLTPFPAVETVREILKIGAASFSADVEIGQQQSASVEHLQLCLRILFKYLKDTQEGDSYLFFMETVIELSDRYNTILESDALDWSTKKLNQERHYCGYLMSKLGHLYSTKGDNTSACKLYTISCRQLTQWVKSDVSLTQQRLQEVSLWLVYECLSDCQKKCGDLPSAMETIQNCLLIDSSHMTSAVKLWVRTKKEAIKNETNTVKQMVLGDQLLARCPDTKLDITDLLNLELLAFRNNRRSYNEVEVTILKVILTVSKAPTVQARALLDIGQLIWMKGITEDKSSLDYIQEAEEVLSGSRDTISSVLLAEVYLWSYIIQHEVQCHQMFHLSHTTPPVTEATPTADLSTGESVDTEDDTSSHTSLKHPSPAMFTFTMETVAMEKLESALALWEAILTGSDGLDNRTDPGVLLTTLMLCSSILRLSRRIKNELRVLYLAQQLVDKHPTLDRSALDIRLLEARILVGQTDRSCTGPQWLEDADQLAELQGSQRDNAVHAMLVHIRQAFYHNQLEKGMTQLTSVISLLESQTCKTRSVCSAEGTAKRLMSMFLGLPDCSQQYRNVYILDLALDAIRMHTGVVQLILGKEFLNFTMEQSIGSNSFDKWSAVGDLVESLLHLGRLYSLAGEDREARCFLREGWQLSHHLCLPYWTMQFSIELAKIHNLSGNIEDATSTVSDCHHMLESYTLDRIAATSLRVKVKPSVPTKILSKHSVNRKLEENFGFESEEEMAQDHEENLSSRLVLPKCYHHIVDKKTCDVCTDPWMSLWVLNVTMVVTHCQVSLGEGVSETLKCIQNICETRMSDGTSISNSKTERKKQKKKLNEDCLKSELIVAEVNKLSLKELYLEAMTLQAQTLSDSGDMELCANVARTGLATCEAVPGVSVHVNQLEANLRLHQVLSQCDPLFNTVQQVVSGDCSATNISAMSSDLFYNDDEMTQVTSSMSQVKIEDCSSVNSALSDMETVEVDQCATGKETTTKNKKTSLANKNASVEAKENTVKKPAVKKVKLLREEAIISTPKRDRSTLSTDLCNTPHGQQYVYTDNKDTVSMPLKTPRSVCSRKARLDLLLDDSDDDIKVKSVRGKTTGRNYTKKSGKKTSNACDIMKTPKLDLLKAISTSTGESDPNKKGRSRIPCRVKTAKTAEVPVEKDNNKNIRLKTTENQEGRKTKLNNSKNQTCDKIVKGRPARKGNKDMSSKNVADIEFERKNEDPDINCASVAATDVYTFDVSDNEEEVCATKTTKKITGKRKPATSKCTTEVKSRTTEVKCRTQNMRNSRRVNGQEKVRDNTGENEEKIFSLVKCLDLPVIGLEEPCSPKVELNLSRDVEIDLLDVKCPQSSDGDCQTIELSPADLGVVAPEELHDLNDSIELLRGDDKGKRKVTTTYTKKGRGRKKEDSSVSDTGSTSGETTEVLRSTHILHTKIPQVTGVYEPTVKIPHAPAVQENTAARQLDASIEETLEKAFQQVHHMPSPGLYSQICHMKALHHLESSPLKAAFYLCEALAVTFRHQALVNSGKKIRKMKRQQNAEHMEVTEEPTDSEGQAFTEKENLNSNPKVSKAKQTGKVQRKDSKLTRGQTGEQKVTKCNREEESDMDKLRIEQESLQFTKSECDLEKMMEALPHDIVVCHLSVVNHPTHHSHLLVSRLEKHAEPVIVSLPGISSLLGQQILPEFTAVMEESRQSLKLTKKAEWWKVRRGLDDRMHSVLDGMENYWLSHWKVLLLGSLCVSDQDRQKLTALTEAVHTEIQQRTGAVVSRAKLRVLLQSGDDLSDQHLTTALSELTRCPLGSAVIPQLVSSIRSRCRDAGIPCEDTKPQHVILVLDKTIQHLPWESIPILRKHSVSRVPSFYHMCVQLSCLQTDENTIYKNGIDSRQTFYFLDPDGNLSSTRETFQAWFQKEPGWKGLVGEKPSADLFKEALTQSDLVIYCGHGSGSKYFHGDDLQQVNCRAATILMGCSSGRLQVKGQLEASGIMLNYFLSGCPCIVSNLWDVTDRDIDRFLESLLTTWLSADKPCSLLDILPAAREVCQLPYLIGSAPVVYGFPVYMRS